MAWSRVTAPGWSYQLTDEDYDTACRVVLGEIDGRGAAWETHAHLWAILHRQYHRKLSSWTKAAQEYSSPVNPRQPLTERRRWVRSLRLSDIPQLIRDRVAAWFTGKVGSAVDGVDLSRVFDFGACHESASIEHGEPDLVGSVPDADPQCYWNAASSVELPSFELSLGTRPSVWPWVALGVVALAGAGVAVAVVVSRRRKRRQLGCALCA